MVVYASTFLKGKTNMYENLLLNQENENFITSFFTQVVRKKSLSALFSKEQIKVLISCPVIRSFIEKYFESHVLEYCTIFLEDSLIFAFQLPDKTLLLKCLCFLLNDTVLSFSSQERIRFIERFLLAYPNNENYLIEADALGKYIQKTYYNWHFLNFLSEEFIVLNLGEIMRAFNHSYFVHLEPFIHKIQLNKRLWQAFLQNIQEILCSYKREDALCFFKIIEILKMNQIDYTNLSGIKEQFYNILLATKEESNPYAQAFTLILDELLAVQNLEATSITFLGQGIHGSVFQIGQYVLKVGDLPEILPVPAHPNVLKPIFRRYLSELDLMVEILPCGNLVESNPTLLQRIFLSCFHDQVVWFDPNCCNFIYLPNLKDLPLQYFIALESISFVPCENKHFFPDYYISDLDLLINREDLEDYGYTDEDVECVKRHVLSL